MKLFFTLLIFLINICDDTMYVGSQEDEKKVIDSLVVEVKTLVETSICSGENKCYSVGIGAKPCGGFWEYIIYSDSIDVVALMEKIEKLNALEKAYNQKYSIQSDCFMAMPPKSINCVDGKCTGVFE